jgi:1,4-alpha-glucan branching enzyme
MTEPDSLSAYQPLFSLTETSPHRLLGLVEEGSGRQAIRLYRPEASNARLVVKGINVEADRIDSRGLFEFIPEEFIRPEDYLVYHQNGLLAHDPYAFELTLSEEDRQFFAEGRHYELYKIMGARLWEVDGISGVRFVVWAPNAARVSVVGHFNEWDGRVNPMSLVEDSGSWELFVPGLKKGDTYKFEMTDRVGNVFTKSDPFALASELRPKNASIVSGYDDFQWSDSEWMEKRAKTSFENAPMSVYEVHMGSWKQNDGRFYNYRELAPMLADYVLEMGFTHVELLPITEYPYDRSWGYQVTGYFAPTRRFGDLDDFQFFVDHLHCKGVGVILDWVPGHFPVDEFSLGLFDGTSLYEHEDPQKGYHPEWHTLIFEFGDPKVANFLIASALFWLKEMHADGLRVDAVGSMLFLDFGRKHGQWGPNRFGGNENLDAVEFFKRFNEVVHKEAPGVVIAAEESENFPKITAPVKDGGLGFDLKWNMGWMNDTLTYFSLSMDERPDNYNELTLSMFYYYSEKFINALSHDEVVYEKKSLLGKMPGDMPEQFANLRLLYSYMVCHPGKQLIFMGGEFGQLSEWDYRGELDWQVRNDEYCRMVKELNDFYLKQPALWEKDFEKAGFQWVDHADDSNCIISYLRKGKGTELLCTHNFLNRRHDSYFFKLPGVKKVNRLFNTDHENYGGFGMHCRDSEIIKNQKEEAQGIMVSLPPLSTVIFEVEE